jgi:hypothetical protein
MARKTLRSFNSVVRELGGLSNTARITKRTPQSVWNWKQRGFFPAILVDVITEELRLRGCDVDRELFRLEKRAA